VLIDAILRSYPVTTQTFHYRRLAELARLGVLGTVWVGRPDDGTIDPRFGEAIAPHIRYIGDLPRPSMLILQRAARLLRHAATLPSPDNGEGGRSKAVHQTVLGLMLGQHLSTVRPQADVLHAMFATVELTIARAASQVCKMPYTVEVHSPTSMHKNPKWLADKLDGAALITPISRYTERTVAALAPSAAGRQKIIHCGLEFDRKPRPTPEQRIGAVSLGSLIPKKGHDIFIRACALADVPGTIIGGGPLEGELRRLATELGANITFLGQIEHEKVLQTIAQADVGVMASRRSTDGAEDGVPVALMEFMAAGVPVCAATVAGIPELVGRRGRLVAENDYVALAAAMTDAIAEGQSESIERAARYASDEHSTTRETTRLIEALQNI
jgi:colanic acid/amylovoran biosynthesis glycosyltransferase